MSAHAFAPNFKYSTLAEAAEVTPVGSSKNDEGNYTVSLREDWCIGVIPHGGYLTTILLNASSKYLFGLTSSAHNPRQPQPDPIHISISFATRCTAGHAQISVAPIKLGRQYSFFRVVLSQRNRRCLEAAVIAADVTAEVGKTLRTQPLWFSIPNRETECSPPVGGDHDPTTKWRVAQKKLLYAFPLEISGKPTVPSVKGQWVKLADGSGNQFRVEDLGFVADMFRPLPENYKDVAGKHWYATLSLTLEVKRLPPPAAGGQRGSWEWLFVRIESVLIRNGRMDIDLIICDEDGEIVALSRHVAIILSASRNSVKL